MLISPEGGMQKRCGSYQESRRAVIECRMKAVVVGGSAGEGVEG